MYSVTFMSRVNAESFVPPDNCAIISIHDKSEPPANLPQNWKAKLTLCFHDTDGAQQGLTIFDKEMALSVLKFVEENKDIEELFVHCQLGISRSAAVAIAIGELEEIPSFNFNGKFKVIANADKYKLYNKKVYRELQNAAIGDLAY